MFPCRTDQQRSLADSVPFREVYIHALVRDANREKMSKTKGNVIDPIEIVKQYGTDAVRFTLASMASPGTDIAFNVARTEGYRAFANKIWNAARFIFMNVDRAAEIGITVDRATLGVMPTVAADAPLEARWIVAELHATAAKVNQSLENYRFDDAANIDLPVLLGQLLRLVSGDCQAAPRFLGDRRQGQDRAALTTLVQVFEAALRLLSPFMPFLTEEIWHAVYDGNPPAKSIALDALSAGAKRRSMHFCRRKHAESVQSLIVAVRALRKEVGVEEKASVPIEFEQSMCTRRSSRRESRSRSERLARVSEVRFTDSHFAGACKALRRQNLKLQSSTSGQIDVAAEREKLTKEIAKLEKVIATAERQAQQPRVHGQGAGAYRRRLEEAGDEAQQLLRKAAPRSRRTGRLATAMPCVCQTCVATRRDPRPRAGWSVESRDSQSLQDCGQALAPRPVREQSGQRIEAEEHFKLIQVAYRELSEHCEIRCSLPIEDLPAQSQT